MEAAWKCNSFAFIDQELGICSQCHALTVILAGRNKKSGRINFGRDSKITEKMSKGFAVAQKRFSYSQKGKN